MPPIPDPGNAAIFREALACPGCHQAFEIETATGDATGLDCFLLCRRCRTTTPVIAGFPLFGETRRDTDAGDSDWLGEQRARWLDAETFTDFLNTKAERNLYDGYAFFQPFNESSRSLLALTGVLREQLSPGDRILDTWCRTGWTGEWLASLFPDQQVLSIWEGNSNVLGYRGFAYWLSAERRLPNLTIVFTHPDEALPLADGCIDLVVGLDSLHRYAPDVFLSECRRVARDAAVLFFPHVHLSNSEPDPFFERGCRQLHGREWKAQLDPLFVDRPNSAYLLAEPDLFDCGDEFAICDDPDTAHYNAAVLIAARSWQGRRVRTEHRRPCEGTDRLVTNPLLRIDLDTATVTVRQADDAARDILERHPIYEERLARVLGSRLSDLEVQVLFLAAGALTLAEIADALAISGPVVLAAVDRLREREIVFAASVSQAMARLQDYYGSLRVQRDLPAHFADLYPGLGERYGEAPLILAEDGSEYDWPAVSSLVAATAHWLLEETAAQDRVLIHTPNCPELLLVVWACWLTGRIAVPVDPTLPADVVHQIVSRMSPAIVFSDLDLDRECLAFDSLTPDPEDGTDGPTRAFYSDRIAPHLDREAGFIQEPKPHDTALVLFTSGSTGTPKAVRLDQRGLLHSAHELARHFDWKPGERLLSLGPAHTMSGLRNPALAALVAGATVVVPDPGLMLPARVLRLLGEHDIDILATVPALLQQLRASRDRLLQEARPPRLQLILTTGQALPQSTCSEIEAWLGAPVRSYYGLTETGGICTADPLDGRLEGDLGVPAGAIAQIMNGDRVLTGPGDGEGRDEKEGEETGELRIFSPSNMLGYWEPSTPSSVRQQDGWIRTGDIVRRMSDGSLSFVGRVDDQVKNRHGELLYLQEIERVALSVPGLADACCLERPDEEGGGLVLFAVLAPGRDATETRNRLLQEIDRVLGLKKRPDDVRAVSEIHRASNGKVDRSRMFGCS